MDKMFKMFPEINNPISKWASIYMEPVIGSGEKLNIAVVAVGYDSLLVTKSIPDDKIKCFFGKQSSKIINLINMVIESLELHLSKSIHIEKWEPPFDGLYLGEIRESNDFSLEAVIKNALVLTSCLGMIDTKIEKLEISDSLVYKETNDHWINAIREEVIKSNPLLDKYFKPKIENLKNIKYDFYSNQYMANFSLIIPYNFSLSAHKSKSRFFDLEYYKKNRNINQSLKFELILGVPRDDDPTITKNTHKKIIETLDVLQESSLSNNISLFLAHNSYDASNRILENTI